MKFKIQQKFMLGKVEDKGSVSLYTLLSLPDFEKVVAIGRKINGLVERSTVDVTLEITTKTERFDLKGEDKPRFVDVARVFVLDVKKSE